MKSKLFQNTLIKKDLLMIHKSLIKDFEDALEDNKIIFTKYFINYGSIVIYFDSNKVVYIFAFKKIKESILEFVKQCFEKYKYLIEGREYEIIVNDEQEIIDIFLDKDLKICDSGSEYRLRNLSKETNLLDLEVGKYDQDRIDEYIEVIDNAFNPLRKRMGKSLNYRKTHYKESVEKLNSSAIKKNLFIFTKSKEIVGICFLNANIIDTLVINPKFQGKNYGSVILNYIAHIIINKKRYKDVYLYVVTENEKAHKFYIKNGYELNAKYRVLKENCDEG